MANCIEVGTTQIKRAAMFRRAVENYLKQGSVRTPQNLEAGAVVNVKEF